MKGIINTSLKIEDVEIPGLKDNVTYQKKYSKKKFRMNLISLLVKAYF